MLTMLMSDDVAAVKEAVDATSGLVRAHAAEIDQTRRLPDSVVSALRRTGINRMFLLTVLGGRQAPVVDVMDMVEGIAAVDGSTAWCTVIGAGSNVFAGYMAEAGARQVFTDPDQGNATMLAPIGTLVADGHRGRLSGRWPFTSNCLHSAWIGLGSRVHRGDGSTPSPGWRSCRRGTSRSRTRGTSSGSGAPAATTSRPGAPSSSSTWCCAFSDRPWPEGTLWRLPLYTVLLPALAAVPLGIARGALDEIGRLAIEGRTARRGQLADDGRVRHRRRPAPRSSRSATGIGRGGPPPRGTGRSGRSAAAGEGPPRERARQRRQRDGDVGRPPARRRRRDLRRESPAADAGRRPVLAPAPRGTGRRGTDREAYAHTRHRERGNACRGIPIRPRHRRHR